MAKDRLTLQDKYGNERDYDVSSEDVTLDNENGKTLKTKLNEIDNALDASVKKVIFNGDTKVASNGEINIGNQMQPDWSESSTSYPSYIRNKPTIPTRTSELTNDAGFITASQIPEGSTVDGELNENSDNAVSNAAVCGGLSDKVDKVTGKGLSTNDYTDADKSKLAGIAAGAQVNVINGIKKHDGQALTPDSNGIVTLPEQTEVDPSDYYDKDEVDELIENIPAGPQGPKGDTVVVDTEGLEQFGLANSLDSSSTTDGLTARQGKILKQAIMTVAANLQAVYNALAGVAFTNLPKPAQTPIDWTGGTFYVAITKSLTGVTDTNDAVQVAENGSYTNILSPQSGLTMKSVVVTMGGVDITSTAYTAATGVISIAQVTGDIVITAVAEQVITYNVTKKLLNMASNAADDTTDADYGYKHNSVVDGESYTDTIAPVSGASYNNDLKVYVGGVLLTAGTDYTYTNNVLTIPAAKVTGDITIVATAATGTVTVRSNTSGTTATVGGTTITCDTADGNEFVGSASSITSFSTLSFSDKTKITSLDFGGAKFTGNLYGSTGLFQDMTALTSLVGLVISGTNTLRQAFSGCSALADVQTIGWDTSNVGTSYTLFQIFKSCSSLVKIDLEYFIRSGAGGLMQEAFYGCSNLSSIRGLNTWIVSGVSSLKEAFKGVALTELDMRSWNTASVTNMTKAFNDGSAKTLKIGSAFSTSNVTSPTSGDYIRTGKLTIEIHSETPPAVNTNNVWFGNVYNWQDNLTIKVPAAALDTYKATEGYSTYESVITTL